MDSDHYYLCVLKLDIGLNTACLNMLKNSFSKYILLRFFRLKNSMRKSFHSNVYCKKFHLALMSKSWLFEHLFSEKFNSLSQPILKTFCRACRLDRPLVTSSPFGPSPGFNLQTWNVSFWLWPRNITIIPIKIDAFKMSTLMSSRRLRRFQDQ